MGIQGLIPFLKKASRQVNIREFSGCTAAVDAYGWLHRGAFSCAEKLVKGEKTDGYIYYCLKMVNSLLAMNITPILVFDGANLPAKQITETKRREQRVKNKEKAKAFLREGKLREARECFQRCTEVTQEMALEVIKACHKKGIDCIVAPYEADAQLAFLNLKEIAHIIITEDSDLVLFGCQRIIFKMDVNGNGILVENSRLHSCMNIKGENYTFDKFRYMCIMSGCDYLNSLPGIGLQKSCKFFARTTNPDLEFVLRKIPLHLNMSSLTVTKEYTDGFIKANNTFLYQLVFDPLKRKLIPLNPYPPGTDLSTMEYAGKYVPNDIAYQMALGNVDIYTKKVVNDFDPDKQVQRKSSSWDTPTVDHMSMWSKDYVPKTFTKPKKLDKNGACAFEVEPTTSSKRKQMTANSTTTQRAYQQPKKVLKDTQEVLMEMYSCNAPSAKRRKLEECEEYIDESSQSQTGSSSLESFTPPVSLNNFKTTTLSPIVKSRYFSSGSKTSCTFDQTSKTSNSVPTLDLFEQIAKEYEIGSLIPTGRNEKSVDIRGVLNKSASPKKPFVQKSLESTEKQTGHKRYKIDCGASDDNEGTNLLSPDKHPDNSKNSEKINDKNSAKKSCFSTSASGTSQRPNHPPHHHPSFSWKKLESFSYGKTTARSLAAEPADRRQLQVLDENPRSNTADIEQNSASSSFTSSPPTDTTEESPNFSKRYTFKRRSPTSDLGSSLGSQLSSTVEEPDDSEYFDDGPRSPILQQSKPIVTPETVNSLVINPNVEIRRRSLFTFSSASVEKETTVNRQLPSTGVKCRRPGLPKKGKPSKGNNNVNNGLRQMKLGESLKRFEFKRT